MAIEGKKVCRPNDTDNFLAHVLREYFSKNFKLSKEKEKGNHIYNSPTT